MERTYITVIAQVTLEGDIFPRKLRFKDGREVAISRRLQTPLRNTAKDGSEAWRFVCLIEARPVTLFYDAIAHRWWINSPKL
ncbi:MAG: hypothetical protein GX850_00610 [Clostridiaceae bacterium]|jgi:hypothetical protein|nr:hypothetical protein [Clostridiaceae bacterium]